MTEPRILIAGIGNIFRGDDAFGVHVAQQCMSQGLPPGVEAIDFGIRGFDLAYAILNEPDATIMIDVMSKGEPPGTLYVVEPDLDDPSAWEAQPIETHGMHPVQVIRLVKAFGGQPKRLLIVGCEPETLGPEEGHIGLSEPVRLAIDPAVALIESLVAKILDEDRNDEPAHAGWEREVG